MVSLYVTFCAVFGENVIYPWSEFMSMPYDKIREIIRQRSKINEEKAKKMEELMQKQNAAIRNNKKIKKK